MTDTKPHAITESNEERQKIQFFNARDARSMMELGLMSVEFPSEVVPLLGEAVENGLIAGDEVKVLFSKPGFSLIHAWLKKDYPLSPHSHDTDCLYWIVSGELQYGTQVLGKGDGFFVPANVPYAYVPVGDNGVEVLEFRHAETFNFKARSGEHFWRKAIETCKSNGQSWKDAQSPLIGGPKSTNSSIGQQSEWNSVADRFWNSLDTGSVDDAIACCLPTATTWHNFDQKTLGLDEAGVGYRAFVAAFSERSVNPPALVPLHSGCVRG